MSTRDDLAARVAEQGWYHTIELAPGIVTKGWFDLRGHVDSYGLPERMDGMRALDVGTWDGFWAFEMERRGAEVVALDVDHESEYDYPPRRRPRTFPDTFRGAGFVLAKEALGSAVERVHHNLYDVTPDDIGTFDLVFCGSVLIHLRDQLLALERLAALCRGRLVLAEEYDRLTSLLPFPAARYHADREKAVVFWLPGRRTWRRMVWTAGFEDVEERCTMTLRLRTPDGRRAGIRHVVIHARGPARA